jgi:hypothetical protein
MKNIIRNVVVAFILCATILCAGGTFVANNAATSTVYDYKWWTLYTGRNKITTSYSSTSTSFGAYSTVDSFKNKKSFSVTHSFSDEETKSATISLGAKVPIKAIEAEVGGSVTYSKTKTYKTSVSVPAYKEFKLQCRVRTEKIKYSSKIQFQLLYTDGKWRNSGKSSTKKSTRTIKSPDWVVK